MGSFLLQCIFEVSTVLCEKVSALRVNIEKLMEGGSTVYM